MKRKSSPGSLVTSLIAGLRSLVLPGIAALCLATPQQADAAADLTVEVAAPAQAAPDGSFTYLVTAKNIGDSAASQLMLVFTVPDGVTILPPGVPTNYTGEMQGRVFSATGAGNPFPAGAQVTFEIPVTGLTRPITVAPGAAVIDPGNLVTESLENNNSSTHTLTTTVPHLLHRWSFDDASDSIGDADLTLFGTASLAGGQLELPGSVQPRVNYASVPIGNSIAAATDLTVEAWFTRDTLPNWSKVWMFGTPQASGQPGLSYLAFTPRADIIPRQDFDLPNAIEGNTGLHPNPPPLNAATEYHVVCVYDGTHNQMRLFIDGVLADTGSLKGANVSHMGITTENFFGAAVYWPDPDLDGRINEVRIWDRPLTTTEITVSHLNGPDTLQLGGASAPSLVSQPADRTIYPGDTATLSVIAEANPPPTFQWYRGVSGDTSDPVAGATSASFTTPVLSAEARYWVSLSNSAGSVSSNAALVTVVPIPSGGPRHRWSFNDASDSTGGATVSLVGNATISGGHLELPGSTTARTHYATLPIGGTIESLTSMTVETWCTLDQLDTWSKLWIFAQVNSLVQPGDAAVSFAPRYGNLVPQIGFDSLVDDYRVTDYRPPLSPIAAGTQFHVAAVFDVPNDEIRFYVDGVLADAVSMGGSTVGQVGNTPLNLLGAESYFNDPDIDGRINEMRIWDRPLGAVEIARNASAGPDQLFLPPAITTQPTGIAIGSGGTATLTVAATGSPAPTFQWYRGNSGDTSNPVSGATSASFTTPALTTTTSYWVMAMNAAGTANSNTATISVLSHPAGETHWTGLGDGVSWESAVNWTAGVPDSTTHAVVDTDSEILVSTDAAMESFDLRSGTVRVGDVQFNVGYAPLLGSYVGGWDGSPAKLVLGDGSTSSFGSGLLLGGPDGGNAEMVVHSGSFASFIDYVAFNYTSGGIAPDVDSEALETSRIAWTFEIEGPPGSLLPPLEFFGLDLTADNGNSIHLDIKPMIGTTFAVGRRIHLATYFELSGHFFPPNSNVPILDEAEFVSNGYTYRLDYDDTAGIVAIVTALAPVVPELVVEGPEGNDLVSGAIIDFGNVLVGTPSPEKTFVIHNEGAGALDVSFALNELAGASIALDVALGETITVPAGQSREFKVAFEPTATGPQSASITIASNDPAQASFTINLTATGQTAPLITSQPASRKIARGSSTTLSVTANAYPAPTYQWYLGETGDTSQPVAGATSAAFTTPALTQDTAYWVRITNDVSSIDSMTATVGVSEALGTIGFDFFHSFFPNTTGISPAENTAKLDIAADLVAPTWHNLDINDVGQGTTSGPNSGRGTGTFGGVGVSAYSSVQFHAGSESVGSDGDASQQVFRVYLDDGEAGNGYFNGDGIGASVHVTGIQNFLAGIPAAAEYRLTVFLSSDGTNNVFPAPTVRAGVPAAPGATAITSLPSLGSATVVTLGDGLQPNPAAGSSAGGTGGTRAFAELSGLTANNLTITMPVRTASIRASVAGFAITALPARAPEIVTQPTGTTITSGQTTTLTAAATGAPTPTYQWYRGNSGDTSDPVSGATSASFTTPALTATTSYWVRATNSAGSDDSDTATVTVPGVPVMVVQGPSGAALSSSDISSFGARLVGSTGAPKTFTVRNTGTGPLEGFTVSKVSGPVSGYIIDSSGSGASIAPGGSKTFTVAFSPQQEGPILWGIQIAGGDGTMLTTSIFGTGLLPGQLAADARVKASPAATGDQFGFASAISGDTVVVGAPLEDSNASGVDGNANDNSLGDSGAAYVYVNTGGEWIQQAYLKSSSPAAGDWFGSAVAISGDTIVVGARERNGRAGEAYVFVRNSGVWSQQAYLNGTTIQFGDTFGASVGISGDKIVVGAPGRSPFAASAYVFERTGTTWTETAILRPTNFGTPGSYGQSIAISGDRVVVGAPTSTSINGGNAGSVHVFSKQGAAWTEETYLTASPPSGGDRFGSSVAVSGDQIVVGAPFEDSAATGVGGDETNDAATDSGAAYVFTRGQGGWAQQAFLKASNTGDGDSFGSSVAIAGDVIAVGAYLEDGSATGVNGADNNNATDAGALYTYHRSGLAWVPWKYLKASDTAAGANLGNSVGVSGDRIVGSAPAAGSAYVFYGVAPVPSLRHRWSFNGNLADTVGGATAQIVEVGSSNATLGAKDVLLAGGTRENADYLELGGGLIPNDGSAFTLEFWATPLSVQYWSRIFNVGSSDAEYLMMTWTHGSDPSKSRTEWRDDALTTSDLLFEYALGQEYHIVLTVEPGIWPNQSTLVTWYAAPATAATLGAPLGSFTTTNLVQLLTDTGMQLGRGPFAADATANARYNEVRIWNHALPGVARESNHVAGPDDSRAPEILEHPQSQSIASGGTATLTVIASSYPAATYQWYEGLSGDTANPVAGATSATFTTPALSTAKSYWVRLTNPNGQADSNSATVTILSSNANLTGLSLSSGTLSPIFTAATTLYEATVASGVDTLTLTPVVAGAGATVKVAGISTASGSPSQPVTLLPGENEIEVTVTAADLTTTRTYQVTVTRLLPMSVATGDASAIGQTAATLAGTVLPNGTAQVRFEYGTTTSYGLSTSASGFSGSSTQPVQRTLTGLVPGQLYHYRIVATNGFETIYGEDRTFTTIVPPPLVMTGQPFSVTTAGATFVGAVDARGLTCQVRFEYGLTNLYGQTAHATDIPAGSGVTDVFKPVTGLVANATYHCRLVATTTSGTTFGQDVTFVATAGTGTGNGVPTAAPEVVTGTVANVGTASAELLGTVDSNGGTTFVSFEYGTTAAYGNTRATLFDVGNVDTAAAVSLSLGGLTPGTLYHYRLVATNSRGTSFGSDATFTTAFLPPSVFTGGATALTTTSVRVFASLNANGASSDAIIQYGVNPASLNLEIDTTPATVFGYGSISLEADLPNLSQGTTYFYRVKATNIYGATSTGDVRSFDVGILSGLDRRFPDEIEGIDHNGSLTVNLTPSGIGSGWRFAGEPGWRAPGSTAGGLASGDRLIEFRPVAGHVQPLTETIAITSGAGALTIDRSYTSSGATGSGAVEIILMPAAISSPEVPVASRAQWRLAGESDAMWRDSDTSASGLVPGVHVIECKPVDGRSTPVPATVVVSDGQTTIGTITYFIAPQLVGTPSSLLDFEAVSTDQDRPYAFAGQILSDAGAGTGFIVKPRVVATAGHVLFDDGTLAATTGVRWLFQRDAGIHEPVPESPRGFYLMTGYAARRGLDNSPGVSSPQSQNLDAGAMYFHSDVSRHGFSGFLASDATVNEFVVSSLQKTLVGYPVEDVPASNIGMMHATPVAPVAFASAFAQTYTTSAIRSGRGNSGGPLCVRNAAGTWYPAAIFLGGTAQTVVRAIDSDVSDLFGFAEASASAGVGETGGSGVIGAQQPFGTPAVGAIRVIIEPAAARAAGARWRVNAGDPYQPSGNQITGLSPNDYTVLLSTVPGFLPPTPQTVAVDGGFLSTLTFTYEEIIAPPVIVSSASASAVRGQPLAYQIQASNTAESFNLFGNLPSGVSFNALTGLISGIPQEAGLFTVTVSATNAGGSGTKQVTIAARPVLAPQSLTALWELPLAYQVIGSESGDGVSWSATGLPQGLAIHPTTGLVSGTPVVAGVFPATITHAKNGASSSATLTLTITGTAPVFTLQPPATRQIEFGTSTVFTVAATGSPAPTYQWFRGESGDTSQPVGSSPTFTTPLLTQSTRYWARASSISGSANSNSVEVTLTPSTNPFLSAIEASAGQLTPTFNPTNADYVVTVPNSIPAISLVPRVQISQTTVTVGGISVIPGTGSPAIPLAVGPNIITIESTAGDGIAHRTYTVTVHRLEPPAVITGTATAITDASAMLNGTVDPNGSVTTYFQYRITGGDWEPTPSQTASGADPVPVQIGIGNLEGATPYEFRIVAVTPTGEVTGDTVTFITALEPPSVATGNPAGVQTDRAIFTGAVNPNGTPLTALRFNYGTSAELLGTIVDVPLPSPNGGTSVVDVTWLQTGLIAQAGYHYRLEAVSAAGTTYGRTVSFTATTTAGGGDGIADSAPFPTTTVDATGLTTGSAVLHGTTFPNDGATLAWFEYGVAGEADIKSTKPQDIGNGSDQANVTQFLGGLLPAIEYRYRIAAENSKGIQYGDYRTFTTVFNPPIAITGAAERLTSTSVLVRGLVRARGTEATVNVEFGTDGIDFPQSSLISENAGMVTGDIDTPVSAVLAGLEPSTRYYARVRATSSGGTGNGQVISFLPGALMGQEQVLPPAVPPVEHQGQLTVTLVPATTGAWRIEGETLWRASGSTATGLTTGDRIVEFQPVAGFISPLSESVGIVSGAAATTIQATYYQAGAPGGASLTVNLLPSSITDAALPVASRAQWRLAGVPGDPWRDSGTALTSLEPGGYLIEFKSVSGHQAPSPHNVIVAAGESRSITRTYFTATAPNLNPPVVVPHTTVSTEEQLPYRHVGQLRSDAGSFTGFVVKRRVVATAGQAVFDEATLSLTTGIQWLHQRDQGVHEPDAQVPRGLYVFDGYAAQREAEATPGTLSPTSRNLNVAALYFLEDAGRGGFSGFVSSDDASNPHLVSSKQKSLAGYPVAGISPLNQGRMHATAPSTSSYAFLTGRTFDSSSIRGPGGMEGGPLSVRVDGGAWYPAGIYVGGTTRGAVRAIDAPIIDLFSRAEVSGNGGGNSTGGGITHTSVTVIGATSLPGAVKVIIEPQAARDAGATWTLRTSTDWRDSDVKLGSLKSGTYILALSTVPGFQAPNDETIQITGGEVKTITFTYALALSDAESWRQDYFGTPSNTGDAADSADPDGDGQTNADEFTAGTHPKNATDRFTVDSIVRSGNNWTVALAAKAGRTYRLERRTTLDAGPWTAVHTTGPIATSGPLTLTDTTPPTSDRAFYRVVVSRADP